MEIKFTPVNFRYNHQLKDLYKSGKLKIAKGLYGGKLTRDNCSLEHIMPHSKKGPTTLDNLALATKENNNLRGNKPLKDFLTIEMLEEYLAQFKDIVIDKFNGNRYINIVKEKVKECFRKGV